MPQVFTSTAVKTNPFFKVAEYSFSNMFQQYIQKSNTEVHYIVLEPVYNNIDLQTAKFDPLSYFSNQILYDIKHNSLKVIFDCSVEGSHIAFPYFKIFLESYQKYNFNFSSFYYLTGDAIEKKVYEGFLNVYNINVLDSFIEDEGITENNREAYFTCLCRKPRYWRSKLIYIINTDSYLKSNSLCSHPKITSHTQISDHTGFDVENSVIDFFLKADSMQVSNKKPLSDDMPFSHVISTLPEVYSKVFFDVTMETFQEGSHEYITEKTFKPMVNLVPTLIWGTPGINTRQLENLGFKTYHDWFDLSFDSEQDTENRLTLLVKEITRICNMLDKMSNSEKNEWQTKNQIVLLHNRNLVLNLLPSNVSEFTRLFNDLHST